MNLNQLRQRLYEEKNRIGLVAGSLTLNEYEDAKHNVSAHIKPQGWDIEITLKSGFNPIQDRRQKAYARVKNISDGLDTLLSDILDHECGHWQIPYGSERGCPFNTYYHDLITEAVKHFLPKEKQSLASYVTNAFEDMIVNPRVHEFRGDFSGQVLFWDNEGIACNERGERSFTPFYEAFVKLNMHLFGEKADTSLLKRHYGKDKRVDTAIQKVIKKLNLQQKADTTYLFNKTSWPAMAQVFTAELADLLDVPPQERLSAFSQSQGDGGDSKDNPLAGNGIEQKIQTREGKEEIAFGRYSSDKKHSPNITKYEQLDALYQRLARDLPVKVEAMTCDQSLVIAPLNFRRFDKDNDDPIKLSKKRIYVDESGVDFGYQKQPLVIHAKEKIQRKSFPDFKMIVLDNSGSMRQSPQGSDNVGSKKFIPWGDESKYHYALLGFYGIENFLRNQGIAQYIKHGVSLFSSQIRYKEGTFQDIEQLRKQALAPEWGSTHLDAELLSQALSGRESFVLSISDGEIENWDSERDTFKKAVEKNHYAHIQIGEETDFTTDLKKWNLPVESVLSGRDLAKLMIDITHENYRRSINK